MGWRTALHNLAGVHVPGIAVSYDLDALPPALPLADLPALVPVFPGGVGANGEGLSTLTYDGAAWRAVLHVDHVLYWAPAANGRLHAVMPALVEAVDAYLGAVRADGLLGGALHEPLAITRVQIGEQAYAGTRYFGACFRHRWVITVR